MDNRTQILTTPGREKQHIGFEFNAKCLTGDHSEGEKYPVRNWNEEIYGLAEIICNRGGTYYLRIIQVW